MSKVSKRTQRELYAAIHETIVDVRLLFKDQGYDDYTMAQVIDLIWSKQKRVLGIRE